MKKIIFILFLIFPNSSFAEEIAVISRYAPVEEITDKTVAKIFLKKKVLWEGRRKIVPVNLDSQNSLRKIFSQKILKKSQMELVEYWNEQYFKGITPPIVLESEEAVKIFIKNVEGAVGYINSKNLEPGLLVLYTINID